MSRFKPAKERKRRRRAYDRKVKRVMEAKRNKRREYRVRRKARKVADRLVPDVLHTTVVWADGQFVSEQ